MSPPIQGDSWESGDIGMESQLCSAVSTITLNLVIYTSWHTLCTNDLNLTFLSNHFLL